MKHPSKKELKKLYTSLEWINISFEQLVNTCKKSPKENIITLIKEHSTADLNPILNKGDFYKILNGDGFNLITGEVVKAGGSHWKNNKLFFPEFVQQFWIISNKFPSGASANDQYIEDYKIVYRRATLKEMLTF